MKNALVVVLCLVFAMLAFAGDWFVSYQAGILDLEDDNIKDKPILQAVELGYSWKNAELGLEGSHTRIKSDKGSSFTLETLMATGKLKYPIKKFTPYAVVGVGSAWYQDKSMANLNPHKCSKPYYETLEKDTSIATKYGIGLQYALTKNISLFTEGVYRYVNTGKTSSLDGYAWNYNWGAKVYF
jgi:opacity protein-like surface antigen